MEGDRTGFSRKRPNPELDNKKGFGNKRGKWDDSRQERSCLNVNPGDTLYRILCPSRKIGGVIGKGGSIVKTLREETRAKITVLDLVPGSDERVIIISSSSSRNSKVQKKDGGSGGGDKQQEMEPHCAAQDALLKVHDRIVEEDLYGGTVSRDDNENSVVTTRLLVPNNLVGCLLGKGGDVIQRLRSETGANIRVLPSDFLPSCAMSTDELVQISGKANVAKRALYEVSTLLHQNPRKDKPPLSLPMPHGGSGFYSPGGPMVGDEGFENLPYDSMHKGFDDFPPEPLREAPAEFSMKILCPASRIGGVIGKGGCNVRQLQEETGASIHVDDPSSKSDERVIRVSAVEAVWNPRSQTIDAVLQLQNKTSEVSEKGIMTTRLLVLSSKVGCILGQGGQIINEMRRRTHADIRVFSKDEKPKCASEEEELVQVSGNFDVARDALAEVSARIRARTLRDATAGAKPAALEPSRRFYSGGRLSSGIPQASDAIQGGGSRVYESFNVDGHSYEHDLLAYPGPRAASGYQGARVNLEPEVPKNVLSPVIGLGAMNPVNSSEVTGRRLELLGPISGGAESAFEARSTSTRSMLNPFMASAGPNVNSQRDSYLNASSHRSPYENLSERRQHIYDQGTNALQSPYSHYGRFPSVNAPQSVAAAYQKINSQSSYHY